MAEPVAWLNNFPDGTSSVNRLTFDSTISENGTRAISSIPLYTAEQLQPRVKMTQTESEEWNKLVEEVADLYTAITEICDTSSYPSLYFRFFDLQNEDTDKTRKTQMEFATLWSIFDEFNPEETIEIFPDMKWFVTSKKKTLDKKRWWLSSIDSSNYVPEYVLSDKVPLGAIKFNTKEDAEDWCTPITKAIQLPVRKINEQ